MTMWKGRKNLVKCKVVPSAFYPPKKVSSLKWWFTEEKLGLRRNSMGLNFLSGTGSQGLSKILFKWKHWLWLCGKAAIGLEKISCRELVKRIRESIDMCTGRCDMTVENSFKHHTINQSKGIRVLMCILGLNPFPNKSRLSHFCSTNTVGKGEIARNE